MGMHPAHFGGGYGSANAQHWAYMQRLVEQEALAAAWSQQCAVRQPNDFMATGLPWSQRGPKFRPPAAPPALFTDWAALDDRFRVLEPNSSEPPSPEVVSAPPGLSIGNLKLAPPPGLGLEVGSNSPTSAGSMESSLHTSPPGLDEAPWDEVGGGLPAYIQMDSMQGSFSDASFDHLIATPPKVGVPLSFGAALPTNPSPFDDGLSKRSKSNKSNTPPTPAAEVHIASALAKPKGDPVESLRVTRAEVNGAPCARVEWSIAHLGRKLAASLSKPIVSPSFEALGLGDLRLMMVPASGTKDDTDGMHRKKKNNKLKQAVATGPIHGGLKLKVGSETPVLKFYLNVGGVQKGPFTWDFSQHSMHGCDEFGIDWLSEMGEDNTITVRLDVLELE